MNSIMPLARPSMIDFLTVIYEIENKCLDIPKSDEGLTEMYLYTHSRIFGELMNHRRDKVPFCKLEALSSVADRLPLSIQKVLGSL